MRAVRIVGRGRAGRGLARAWKAAGLDVSIVARQRAKVDAGVVVVIAVPDPAIASVDEALARAGCKGAIVLHCAGSRGPDALAKCRAAGAHTGVMHPLASFADPKHPPELAGTTFVIDGAPRAIAAAKKLARALDARAVVAPVHGPSYHAAAALAANGASALAATAVRVMRELGLSKRDAERAIGALLRTVGDNVANTGVPGALTGSIVRGDDAAVLAHRAALERVDPAARAAYEAIAPAILSVAIDAGLSRERARAIERALNSPQRKNRF